MPTEDIFISWRLRSEGWSPTTLPRTQQQPTFPQSSTKPRPRLACLLTWLLRLCTADDARLVCISLQHLLRSASIHYCHFVVYYDEFSPVFKLHSMLKVQSQTDCWIHKRSFFCSWKQRLFYSNIHVVLLLQLVVMDCDETAIFVWVYFSNGSVCAWQQQYHISSIRRHCRRHVPQHRRWPSCGRHGQATSTHPLLSATRWNINSVITIVVMRVVYGDRGLLLNMPAMHSKWQRFWTCDETLSTSFEFCRYSVSGNRTYVALSAHRVDRSGPSVMVNTFCRSHFLLFSFHSNVGLL